MDDYCPIVFAVQSIMVLDIKNNQRKAIREFYLINDLYCDRLNKVEDLSVKEKESNDNEAQKEKSAIINNIQER